MAHQSAQPVTSAGYNPMPQVLALQLIS
jgi:hypothetical protein